MSERKGNPPHPSEIASKQATIRAGWSRYESRMRRRLAALKQQQLFRTIRVREPDCRHAV